MAVEWYYLETDEKIGPVSSEQLKKLAASGAIMPWTPVCRVSGSDKSPWKRAGEVNKLFAGDITGQIGQPICEDCGKILTAGNCADCESFQQPIDYPMPPEPPRVMDSVPGGSEARTDNSSKKELKAKAPPTDLFDAVLVFFAVLLVAGSLLVGYASIGDYSGAGHRFKSDNAVGATANAVETIRMSVLCWMSFLTGIALLAYSNVRCIRRSILRDS